MNMTTTLTLADPDRYVANGLADYYGLTAAELADKLTAANVDASVFPTRGVEGSLSIRFTFRDSDSLDRVGGPLTDEVLIEWLQPVAGCDSITCTKPGTVELDPVEGPFAFCERH